MMLRKLPSKGTEQKLSLELVTFAAAIIAEQNFFLVDKNPPLEIPNFRALLGSEIISQKIGAT